jgi:hypothetical protein
MSTIKKQRKALGISKIKEKRLPSEALADFIYSAHSVPKVINFFIKICKGKKNISIRIAQGTKGKKRKTTTHIIRRTPRLMGFKGNVGFLRLLRTLGASSHRNFFDRSSGSLWGLRGMLNFLRRGSIRIYIFGRRSNGSIPFRVLIVTAKKAKGKRFYTTRKEESK